MPHAAGDADDDIIRRMTNEHDSSSISVPVRSAEAFGDRNHSTTNRPQPQQQYRAQTRATRSYTKSSSFETQSVTGSSSRSQVQELTVTTPRARKVPLSVARSLPPPASNQNNVGHGSADAVTSGTDVGKSKSIPKPRSKAPKASSRDTGSNESAAQNGPKEDKTTPSRASKSQQGVSAELNAGFSGSEDSRATQVRKDTCVVRPLVVNARPAARDMMVESAHNLMNSAWAAGRFVAGVLTTIEKFLMVTSSPFRAFFMMPACQMALMFFITVFVIVVMVLVGDFMVYLFI